LESEKIKTKGRFFMATNAMKTPRFGRIRAVKNLASIIATFLGFLVVVGASTAFTSTESFTGEAINKEGQLEYIERHTVTYANGQVIRSLTKYIDSHNNAIGELVSEYLSNPQFNSYTFKDIRAKYEDGVTVAGDRLLLYRKTSPEQVVESAQLPKQATQIVGQGFHHFLKRNLEAIAGGEIFHVQLVMPSRLDQFSFRIRKRKVEHQTLHVRLEVENWFLRLFAPNIDCEYDLKTGRLLRYVGISNLEDASGSHKEVSISYTYGE
jgi:hypothetical protein